MLFSLEIVIFALNTVEFIFRRFRNFFLKIKYNHLSGANYMDGAEGFEPPGWLDQNQLPYHLATPQYRFVTFIIIKYQDKMSSSFIQKVRLDCKSDYLII